MSIKKQDQDAKKSVVIKLPNNVSLVSTATGTVLVHSPPETLKSILSYGHEIPEIILIPQDVSAGKELGSTGFVRSGINYACIEFLLYAQFFGKGQKCLIVTHTLLQKERLEVILNETFIGPLDQMLENNMAWLIQECQLVSYFPPLGRAPTWSDLCDIISLDQTTDGLIRENTSIAIDNMTHEYIFCDHSLEIARVSTEITEQAMPISFPPSGPIHQQELTLQFIGGSDGFDPDGITTCFLAWVHTESQTYATLFDTAAFMRQRLGHLGLSTRQISEVVISHLHEDHIAGLPELILMGENQIQIITSDLIYKSLLKVLTAIFNLPTDEVASLFRFIPLNPGSPLMIDDRKFSSLYAVHSIPTLAIRLNGLYFSGDMRYDEVWFDELVTENVLSHERRDELVGFAEGASVIVQDAGGGTIHTTITRELLERLLSGGRRVILAHTKPELLPHLDKDLENRIDFASSGQIIGMGESVPAKPAEGIMETIISSALLARLPFEMRHKLSQTISKVKYKKGDKIISHGEAYNGYVYLVHSGLIEVKSFDLVELRLVAGRGSIIGERSALKNNGQKTFRVNHTYAQSDVELIQINGELFRQLANFLGLEKAFIKAEWLLEHSPFRDMLWADILDLALDLRVRHLKPSTTLYEFNSPGYESFLLVSGVINLLGKNGEQQHQLTEAGSFFGGRATLFNELHRFQAITQAASEVWVLHSVDLKRMHMVHPHISLHLRGNEMMNT
ncbi:MAG: CRP-like cAMP-binding protein [Cellvibrionaceae bacterium]|jgi:CRP-like cAMP-binding protein